MLIMVSYFDALKIIFKMRRLSYTVGGLNVIELKIVGFVMLGSHQYF